MPAQTASPAADQPPDLDALPADAHVGEDALAALYHCSSKHVQRMVAAGELPAPSRIGRLKRWRVGTLRDFIRGNQEGQPCAR